MKASAETTDMISAHLALCIEHFGNDATGPENIDQILLHQAVLIH